MLKSAIAALAAGIMASAAFAAPASAQTVDPVELEARPTQVAVRIAGKHPDAVRRDVRSAAYYVCRNATRLGELDVGDLTWCALGASAKAMRTYQAAAREGRLAQLAPLQLSAR